MTTLRRARLLVLLLVVCAAPASSRARSPAPPRARTAPVPVSDCATCGEHLGVIAGSAGLDVLVPWQEEDGSGRIFVRLVDASGNGGAITEVSPQLPAGLIGTTNDGTGWLLGYSNPARVYLQRADGAGTLVGTPLSLNEGITGDSHGTALVARNGRSLATMDLNRPGVPTALVVQWANAQLVRVGAPIELGPAPPHAATRLCLRPDGSGLAAWANFVQPAIDLDHPPRGGVRARLVGAAGVLSPLIAPMAPALVTLDFGIAVACAADGSFAVGWNTNQRPAAASGWDVAWRWYDSRGRARAKATRINELTGGDQLRPAILVLSNRTVLAVWESRVDGSAALRGRRFSAGGLPLGTEFVLYEAADGEGELRPQLALIPGSGRFALAWQEGGRGWVQLFSE